MPRVITTVDELGRMLYTMVMEEVGRKRGKAVLARLGR